MNNFSLLEGGELPTFLPTFEIGRESSYAAPFSLNHGCTVLSSTVFIQKSHNDFALFEYWEAAL